MEKEAKDICEKHNQVKDCWNKAENCFMCSYCSTEYFIKIFGNDYITLSPDKSKKSDKKNIEEKVTQYKESKKNINELIEQFREKLTYLRKSQNENERLGKTAIHNIRKIVVAKNSQIENVIQKIIPIIKHMNSIRFHINCSLNENEEKIHNMSQDIYESFIDSKSDTTFKKEEDKMIIEYKKLLDSFQMPGLLELPDSIQLLQGEVSILSTLQQKEDQKKIEISRDNRLSQAERKLANISLELSQAQNTVKQLTQNFLSMKAKFITEKENFQDLISIDLLKISKMTQINFRQIIPFKLLLLQKKDAKIMLSDISKISNFNDLSLYLQKKYNLPAKIVWEKDKKIFECDSDIKDLHLKENEYVVADIIRPFPMVAEVIPIDPREADTIQTYSRFPIIWDSNFWNISSSGCDAITFKNNQSILLFGFGTYGAKIKPASFQLSYELRLNGKKVIGDTRTINTDEKIEKVFFNENKEPIAIPLNSEFSILIKYPYNNPATKLWYGKDGDKHNSMEGNKKDLFIITNHSECNNGTNTNKGQIPELYFCLDSQFQSQLYYIKNKKKVNCIYQNICKIQNIMQYKSKIY